MASSHLGNRRKLIFYLRKIEMFCNVRTKVLLPEKFWRNNFQNFVTQIRLEKLATKVPKKQDN